MRLAYPYIMATIIALAFTACKKGTILTPVAIYSPYTTDMCGSHSFHYTESGHEPSHGTYSLKYDTAMVITYINDTYVNFNKTKFKCTTATDSIIIFSATFIDSTTSRHDITYNRNTQDIIVYRAHYYMNPHGYVNMGPSSEKWVSY